MYRLPKPCRPDRTMPRFSYKAIGRDGKSLNGVIEADGLELASRQLRGQGLTLLKLESGRQAR